ncbi:hypothetical protein [Leptolyngbya phage Lsp-JY17]
MIVTLRLHSGDVLRVVTTKRTLPVLITNLVNLHQVQVTTEGDTIMCVSYDELSSIHITLT